MLQKIKQFNQDWVSPLAKDVFTLVSDILFPIYCLGCEKYGEFLCTHCKAHLTRIESQECIACHKPSPMGITHAKCVLPLLPDGSLSLFDYHDKKISTMIIKGKYSFIQSIYEELGLLAGAEIRGSYPFLISQQFVLCPIPLSPSRKRWRGFNQSEILCNSIQKNTSMEIADVLARNRSTKTQKDLKKEQRAKNMANAFSLKPNVDIKHKNILLVDDVTTTGTTLLEAVKVLKRNHSGRVWCMTIAKD